MTNIDPTQQPEDAEVIDVEGTEHEATTAALVPTNASADALMRPVASLETTVDAFHAYQDLRNELLDPSDFQEAERGKHFVTKSGWRKLAVAMGVSDELIKWEDVEDPFGRVRRSKVTVRAIAPNGRYGEGIGVCDYRERCCDQFYGETCNKRHTHCTPECNGFRHFSKAQHDIPSTAHTRAKNRALSDLFGFGEVSADEVSGGSKYEEKHDEPAPGERVAVLTAALEAIEDRGQRRGVKLSLVQRYGQPHEWMTSQLPQIERAIQAAGGTIQEPDAAAGIAPEQSAAPPDSSVGEGSAGTEVSAGGDVEDRQSHVAGPPIASPPSSPVPSTPTQAANGADETPGDAGRPPAPAPPAVPQPSTTAQRRQVGMLERELNAAGKVKHGDKAEIVAILSNDRVTSMADTNYEEAVRVYAALKLIESGDMTMADDPNQEGARAFAATTAKARDFLVKVGLLQPAATT